MASTIDISASLTRLTNTLPPPRGVSMDKAFNGYVTALQHFGADEIDQAIDRYLAAEFPDVSLKFYPRAPELAGIIRLIREEKARAADKLNRAAQIQQQIAEGREIEERCHKTPEQLSRAARIYGGFLASRKDAEAEERRLRVARERGEIRARYGMTAEVLAGVKDAPAARQFQDKDFGGLA